MSGSLTNWTRFANDADHFSDMRVKPNTFGRIGGPACFSQRRSGTGTTNPGNHNSGINHSSGLGKPFGKPLDDCFRGPEAVPALSAWISGRAGGGIISFALICTSLAYAKGDRLLRFDTSGVL
jgi:hypothetical protein